MRLRTCSGRHGFALCRPTFFLPADAYTLSCELEPTKRVWMPWSALCSIADPIRSEFAGQFDANSLTMAAARNPRVKECPLEGRVLDHTALGQGRIHSFVCLFVCLFNLSFFLSFFLLFSSLLFSFLFFSFLFFSFPFLSFPFLSFPLFVCLFGPNSFEGWLCAMLAGTWKTANSCKEWMLWWGWAVRNPGVNCK